MLTEIYQPMEPILRNDIIQSPHFIHQIKWDGIRGITYIYESKIKVRTKNNNDVTAKYPELENLIKQFKGQSAALDGEMVVLDEEGKPSFEKILKRHMLKTDYKINYYVKKNPILYIIFDLLFLNGQDLRSFPYKDRKELLQKNYVNSPLSAISDDFEDAASLFKLMKEKKMEGIVSKDLESPYIAGKKHKLWYKTKIKKKMMVVVGGLKLKNDAPISLLIGIYHNQDLVYIGSVSSGLSQKDISLLKSSVPHLRNPSSPFVNHNLENNIIWFKPVLTCIVRFSEKNSNGHLRHPEILGFTRSDPKTANGEEKIINDITL